MKSFKTLDI